MFRSTMEKLFVLDRKFVHLSITLVLLISAIIILEANPALGDVFTCTPNRIAAFDNRVHVRCSAAAPNGIVYFAVSSTDSGRSSRYLSIFTTAKVTGKNLFIYYDPNDLSGAAWGCQTNDCRNIWGAEVLP